MEKKGSILPSHRGYNTMDALAGYGSDSDSDSSFRIEHPPPRPRMRRLASRVSSAVVPTTTTTTIDITARLRTAAMATKSSDGAKGWTLCRRRNPTARGEKMATTTGEEHRGGWRGRGEGDDGTIR